MGLRLCLIAALCACHGASETPSAHPSGQRIRVAVIGGMMETGLWPEVAARYERLTGNTIEVVASGPKPQVVEAFRAGGIDLITVHACDAMVNLVADGLARDPQPWARNDLVIVGPADDPAGIRGKKDALVAIGKIIETKVPLLVHASMGADGVLHDLVEAGHLKLDPGATILFDQDNQHAVLDKAAAAHAYTLIGRIPFIMGKLKAEGIELMVQGDPRLRRPYLVEVARDAPEAARDLAQYLRDPETQDFIAVYGKGKWDDLPLFFPVTVK